MGARRAQKVVQVAQDGARMEQGRRKVSQDGRRERPEEEHETEKIPTQGKEERKRDEAKEMMDIRKNP